MDFLRTHKKICSAVAALMVAVLVVYCYGSFRSYAAAPEVSTLPADDIGAEVAYDADSITLKYNGNTYVFNRHLTFDELISDLEPVDELDSSLLHKVQHVKGSDYLYWFVSSNTRYRVDFSSGCYLERPSRDGSSYVSPVSYWLSPSHNCVYILYDDVYGNRSSIIVRSYSNGSFYYVLNPDSSLSPYWFAHNSLSWSLLSTESNMYAKWFEVSCNYEFTDYTLVYTNDKNFGGDPLVTPDWGDFSDVIEKLPDITDVYDNLLSHKTDKQTTALTGINKFMYNIVSGLTSNIGLGGLYDSIVRSIKGDSYTYSLSEYMLTNLNNDLSVIDD